MSELTPSTRPSLLARIRDPQDSASWQTFVTIYTPLVYRYARRKGFQDADAADLAQEVLTEVARSIPRFDYEPERGRFRDWLGCIARRQIARFLERRQRGGAVAQPGDELDRVEASQADPEWVDEYNTRLLQVVLEQAEPHFEPATWKAFVRVWIDGKPAREVADELQVPIDSVYVAKSRVLKRLAEELRILAEDHPLIAASR